VRRICTTGDLSVDYHQGRDTRQNAIGGEKSSTRLYSTFMSSIPNIILRSIAILLISQNPLRPGIG
jgi:hypothetical protein